ncbi:hypothetical protein QLX08_000490 [Tetragonisca angustula]|uniref:Uncharacterized protein n=1 Tax=Tetragonisca angustula TaxID=166442 RepID=A0AAW1AJ70_9HYME
MMQTRRSRNLRYRGETKERPNEKRRKERAKETDIAVATNEKGVKNRERSKDNHPKSESKEEQRDSRGKSETQLEEA